MIVEIVDLELAHGFYARTQKVIRLVETNLPHEEFKFCLNIEEQAAKLQRHGISFLENRSLQSKLICRGTMTKRRIDVINKGLLDQTLKRIK